MNAFAATAAHIAEVKEKQGLVARDYWNAMLCESACNLSGVAISFAEVVVRIRQEPDCTGTAYVNHHPISIMYGAKLCEMSSDECLDLNGKWTAARAECRKRFLALGGTQDQLKGL